LGDFYQELEGQTSCQFLSIKHAETYRSPRWSE
jgi:hypothetical protein